MNKYSFEFININKLNTDYAISSYFENCYIKFFSNLEFYIFDCNNLAFMLKPFIRVQNNYYELTEILSLKNKRMIVFEGSYEKLFFKYCFSFLSKSCYKIQFEINNEFNKEFIFHFLFVLKNNNSNKFEKISIYKNIYKYGNLYIFVPNISAVNFNVEKYFGYNIKKIKNECSYFDYTINIDNDYKKINAYIFLDKKSLEQFLYVGENKYIANNNDYIKYSLEIFSTNDLFDNKLNLIIDNYSNNFYKAFHCKDNFYFNLDFVLLFDKNIIKFVIKDTNNICLTGRLHLFLKLFIIYKVCFSGYIDNLVDNILQEMQYTKLMDYYYLFDLLNDIEKIDDTCKFYDKLQKLKFEIIKKIQSVNFDMVYYNIKDILDVDNIILLAKYSSNFNRVLYDKLIENLIENNYFNIENDNKSKYYESLFYLYCDKTKDYIYDRIINEQGNYIDILTLVVNKMIGYNLQLGTILVNPKLPKDIKKILFNYKFNNGMYTIIAKQSADCFNVNDIEYNYSKPVRMVEGFIKIISSSS